MTSPPLSIAPVWFVLIQGCYLQNPHPSPLPPLGCEGKNSPVGDRVKLVVCTLLRSICTPSNLKQNGGFIFHHNPLRLLTTSFVTRRFLEGFHGRCISNASSPQRPLPALNSCQSLPRSGASSWLSQQSSLVQSQPPLVSRHYLHFLN